MSRETSTTSNKIKIFRWFFLISTLQVCLYYVVPAIQFPRRVVVNVEVISAMSLGNVVAVFFLLVNICGAIIDRQRRRLYVSLLVAVVLWLSLVAVAWSHLERWEFLLR